MTQTRKKRTKNTEQDSIANLNKFATPGEAAQILEVDPRTIRRLIEKGEIQGARVGGQFKISRASLAAIIDKIEGIHAPAAGANVKSSKRKPTVRRPLSSSSPAEGGAAPLAASAHD